MAMLKSVEARAEDKRLRLAYRETARRLYAGTQKNLQISVSEHANVSPTEGGAFVEAVVWVPRASVKDEQCSGPFSDAKDCPVHSGDMK